MTISEELHAILEQLAPHAEHASIRGQGRAAFVFARHHGRAVEISESDNQWWLEFWEAGSEEDATPAKERTLPSSQEAVAEARAWLAARPGPTGPPVAGAEALRARPS